MFKFSGENVRNNWFKSSETLAIAFNFDVNVGVSIANCYYEMCVRKIVLQCNAISALSFENSFPVFFHFNCETLQLNVERSLTNVNIQL